MFKKIIVATDLSPASFAVVGCLGSLRTYGTEQCLLLQCLSLQDVGATALSYTTQRLEGILAEQKALLEKAGFAVETRTIPGFAKREINRIADAEDFPLIVIGSHGSSMVKEAVLGGVAYGVIHSARRPVLIVPVERGQGGENVCRVERSDFTGHILYPTDFSPNADRAFALVKKMATAGASRVTLLHVQEKTAADKAGESQDPGMQADTLALDRLKVMGETLRTSSSAIVETKVLTGSPFPEITRQIEASDVQLIVMGSQGHGFVKELFLGSVSHEVTRHSTVPVLLVPAAR